MADYLKTNEASQAKAEDYYKNILLQKMDQELAEKVRDLFLAKKEYLDAAMDRPREIQPEIG